MCAKPEEHIQTKLKIQTGSLLHTTYIAQGKNYCLCYVTEVIIEFIVSKLKRQKAIEAKIHFLQMVSVRVFFFFSLIGYKRWQGLFQDGPSELCLLVLIFLCGFLLC